MNIIDDSEYLPDDAARWQKNAQQLVRLRQVVPATDWLPGVDVSGSAHPDDEEKDRVSDTLRDSHREALQERCASVSAWLQNLPQPELSMPARYWMLHSIDAAIDFCDRVVMGTTDGQTTTVVPYPNLDEQRVVYWLLIEWWGRRGLHEFLSHAISDPVMYYSGRE